MGENESQIFQINKKVLNFLFEIIKLKNKTIILLIVNAGNYFIFIGY